MIKITIAYPRVWGRTFDHDYFFNRHLPRLLDVVGAAAARVTVEREINAPAWPKADHDVICSVECETREAFEAAFFPHMEELQDDMERCGGAAPTIHISEIVLDQAVGEAPARRQEARLHHLCPPMRGGGLAVAAAG